MQSHTFFTAMVFDQVQFIGINLGFKHGSRSISSHYMKPSFSPAVIGFLLLIITHKFKLSSLSSSCDGPLMTLCNNVLISSYFELTFIPFDLGLAP